MTLPNKPVLAYDMWEVFENQVKQSLEMYDLFMPGWREEAAEWAAGLDRMTNISRQVRVSLP